jgi:predicted PurR-regulated permease PerM
MTDQPTDPSRRVPVQWVKAITMFWIGGIATLLFLYLFERLFSLTLLLLVSLFLSLAVEPGVNYLARRGWRRGAATATILIGILLAFLLFVLAMGSLAARQVADLLTNSEDYIRRVVDFLNDTFGTSIDPAETIDAIQDPNGPVQEFIRGQQDTAVRLSLTVLNLALQTLSVALFTFYLVADGPRLRRAICSRLRPASQQRVLSTWELAIDKTGGYLYSRALLAALSAFAHWVLFQSLGIQAPLALAIWVGLISQFVPVVGTYIAGALPVVLTLLDSPVKALIIIIFVIVYQQVENYLLLPRITARTMDLHPAIAFGAALGGAAVLGAVGAVLAIPAAAMAQALISAYGSRHEVLETHLTAVPPERAPRRGRSNDVAP